MKKFILILAAVLTFSSVTKADEGMWILSLIGKNYNEMKQLGFKLTPEDIYSVNHSCIKDAIISLNNGNCTAEFVSAKGLLLTNHHCAMTSIANHDVLSGYWAKSMDEELPNPGFTASQLIDMTDVTERILANLPDDDSKEDIISDRKKMIQKELSDNGKYVVKVTNFFDGNYYYAFKYLIYKDVRLVAAPPQTIGGFGGDTDNWMWPRHTVDFSMFRVYVAPDGSPADYNKDNVPLNTKKFLTISLDGYKENDFAMTIGYPSRSNRYTNSSGLRRIIDNQNSAAIKTGQKKLQTIKHFSSDPFTRAQYADDWASCSNHYKYCVIQNRALEAYDIIGERINEELNLLKWIKADPSRNAKYGSVLTDIRKYYASSNNVHKAVYYFYRGPYASPKLMKFVLKHRKLNEYLKNGDMAKAEAEKIALKAEATNFFKDYNSEIDLKIMNDVSNIYKENVESKYYPSFFNGTTLLTTLTNAYNNTIFNNQDSYLAFIEAPSKEAMENDPFFKIANEWMQIYQTAYNDCYKDNSVLLTDMKLWTEAYLEKNADKNLYPDANGTMRLSYGSIKGYANNGLSYTYYTDFDGMVAKADTKNKDFAFDKKLMKFSETRDFGKYAVKGSLPICFLTNNDVVGGNSGSPCLNGNGEIIGIVFDGNEESVLGDIKFDKTVQRTICVDIRMVLFMLDKYADCQNIMKELVISTQPSNNGEVAY
ncbi:MAG: S46 family peptidase [Bacteroidales bacterium]|nr:S46 family peptidase [Bacteroidales bacterium]